MITKMRKLTEQKFILSFKKNNQKLAIKILGKKSEDIEKHFFKHMSQI